VAEKFAPLAGMRVGLITNHTGRDAEGRRTIDLLRRAPGVTLKVIFGPEHGLTGAAAEGARVASGRDPATQLPVYSLYGRTTRPADKMLEGLDALVFDIQDAGVRFYTYITTLGYAMEAAAQKGIPFYVLDRPNPINGFSVQGPVLDKDLTSFVGYFPMPVRHGMTVGELAEMFNRENKIGAKLHIIKMQDWVRTDWFDETGLPWVGPSPNLRTLTEATLYPGVAMVEGANVSVGRGTDTPFELLGARWIHSQKLATHLNERKIQASGSCRWISCHAAARSRVWCAMASALCCSIGRRLTRRNWVWNSWRRSSVFFRRSFRSTRRCPWSARVGYWRRSRRAQTPVRLSAGRTRRSSSFVRCGPSTCCIHRGLAGCCGAFRCGACLFLSG